MRTWIFIIAMVITLPLALLVFFLRFAWVQETKKLLELAAKN